MGDADGEELRPHGGERRSGQARQGAVAWIPLTGEMRMLCVNRRKPPRSLSGASGRNGVSGLPPDRRIGDSCSDEDLGFPFPGSARI
jgi:hypothetical protein